MDEVVDAAAYEICKIGSEFLKLQDDKAEE